MVLAGRFIHKRGYKMGINLCYIRIFYIDYQMTEKIMRMWLVVLGIALTLTGCRFWSLYQFGEQFCEFDEYVKVSQNVGALHIDFYEPVLPQAVLLRYLNAE